MSEIQRFLVLMTPPPEGVTLSLLGGTAQFSAVPLFESIDPVREELVTAPRWYVIESVSVVENQNLWDVCHRIVSDGFDFIEGSKPDFAEPDLLQQWSLPGEREVNSRRVENCSSVPQDIRFPTDGDNFWYQDAHHADFVQALSMVPATSVHEAVRVAHLDTGYDPNHLSIPRRLDTKLQRNYVDANRPGNASDDSAGLFNNRGHGTGTISILAGNPIGPSHVLGAAPFLNVVPIRVANRVELFYTSAVARAFDYVHKLTQAGSTVHVVSMSMGGLASRAWAVGVNALYEQGTVVVTAAGNNYANLPTRNIVYPARFRRVIAACGVMADHSAYADLAAKLMAGNYGPPQKMHTAMAAYTPNVPWAKMGCVTTIDYDGAGTSAATPQIAAAAAIWIQFNKDAFQNYAWGWMRVESVRAALFNSARNSSPTKFGRGELRAMEALKVPPADPNSLAQERPDTASFPILRVLLGTRVGLLSESRFQMLELEALQLSQSSHVERVLPDPDVSPESIDDEQKWQIAKALATHPSASAAMQSALRSANGGF